MALKVKARERLQKVGKYAGTYRYVMLPELYSALSRIVFTPAQEVKDELKSTSVIITCYDREGNEVKRVISADEGVVEDNGDNGQQTTDNGQQTGGDDNGGGGGNDGPIED